MYSQILYILNYTSKFLSIREYHNFYCRDVTDTAKYLKFTTELLLSRETNIYLTFRHVLNRLFPFDNLGFITLACIKQTPPKRRLRPQIVANIRQVTIESAARSAHTQRQSTASLLSVAIGPVQIGSVCFYFP